MPTSSRVIPLGFVRATLIDNQGAPLVNKRVTILEEGTNTLTKAYALIDSISPIDPNLLTTNAKGVVEVWIPMGRTVSMYVYGVNSKQVLGSVRNVRAGEYTDAYDDNGAPNTLTTRDATVLDNSLVFVASGDVVYTIPAGLGAQGFNCVSLWLGDTGSITVEGATGVLINGTDAGSQALGTVYNSMVVQRIGTDSYAVLGGSAPG